METLILLTDVPQVANQNLDGFARHRLEEFVNQYAGMEFKFKVKNVTMGI